MKTILTNNDGKAAGVVLVIIAVLVVIPAIAVALTVSGSIKYPPSAVEWPGVGSFIGQYGSFYEVTDEDAEEVVPETESADSLMDMQDNNTAQILRDLTYKKQRIEELEGQIETKNDQIVKLEESMQAMKTQLTNYKPANRKALIKIYDRMEVPAAVEILSQIPEERAVIILSSLRDSKAAEILSAMEEEAAIKITELMAGFETSRVTDLTNPKPKGNTRLPGGLAPISPVNNPGMTGPEASGSIQNPGIAPNPPASGGLGSSSQSGIIGPPPPPEEEMGPPPAPDEKEKKTDSEDEKDTPEKPAPEDTKPAG